MQEFSEANKTIQGQFFVWRFRGREIEAFYTQSACEATIRRQFKGSWSSDYIFDADGSFLFLGLQTDHSYTTEIRDAVTGLELV